MFKDKLSCTYTSEDISLDAMSLSAILKVTNIKRNVTKTFSLDEPVLYRIGKVEEEAIINLNCSYFF